MVVPSIGLLTNNTWNKAAAGAFTPRQCLVSRTNAGATQYGWSWNWPVNGSTIYANPELILGWKPWDGGTPNTSQLPARIAGMQSFTWSYNVDVTTGGKYNLATSMWITRTGATFSTPNPQDIANEFMIWTAGEGFTPGGQYVTTANIGGRSFEIWYARDWGDLSGANPNKWSYVAYRAVTSTLSTSLDVKAIVGDAIARGYVDPQHFISNIELGNEIMSGSGQTWINSVSLTVQ